MLFFLIFLLLLVLEGNIWLKEQRVEGEQGGVACCSS
jgi:hypothetical protein